MRGGFVHKLPSDKSERRIVAAAPAPRAQAKTAAAKAVYAQKRAIQGVVVEIKAANTRAVAHRRR